MDLNRLKSKNGRCVAAVRVKLTGNAVKFTPEGGVVSIHATAPSESYLAGALNVEAYGSAVWLDSDLGAGTIAYASIPKSRLGKAMSSEAPRNAAAAGASR